MMRAESPGGKVSVFFGAAFWACRGDLANRAAAPALLDGPFGHASPVVVLGELSLLFGFGIALGIRRHGRVLSRRRISSMPTGAKPQQSTPTSSDRELPDSRPWECPKRHIALPRMLG
jgi:hypothetical protein